MRLLPTPSYIPTIKGLWNNFLKREAVYPFYASFKITSRCHFGCPFCNMNKDLSLDLSTEEVKLILDNLSRSPILMTSFEGGEPLLRDDIGELLEYAQQCKFYLLFTTSAKNMFDYSIEKYAKYIDFLHISIDEGHDNLGMFEQLPKIANLSTQVSVQVVVTQETIENLEDKVRTCYNAGVNIVIIPASPMEGAKHSFPNIDELESIILELYKKYPRTIHTPIGYFKAFRNQRCSSASIIIAPDGLLYYPCHILESKGPDLRKVDLSKWLLSADAKKLRQTMNICQKNCGWYQYYSINSYISPSTVFQSLGPIFKKRS